jgi:hypothetical protein
MMRFAVTSVSLALLACATGPASGALRQNVGGYEVEVLVDGVPAPTFQHAGESYAMGQIGSRYLLRVHNHTGRRIEAVVSVDGRDVIDGRQGDFRGKRGYLVPAYGFVDIDGWRTSQRDVAAFRFSSVADSYAARMGSARNVGVVGVAVFPERVYMPPPPPPPPYYPDYSYRDRRYYPEDRAGGRAEAQKKAAPEPPASAPAPSAGARGGRGYDSNDAIAEGEAPRRSRPGLGTEFGEQSYSPVRQVYFQRANPSQPAVMLGLRYNDRDGLIALGIDVDGPAYYGNDNYLRRTADPFPVSHHRLYATPPPRWRD